MTCDCEKKEQDNGHDCPEGQKYDADKGQCVDKTNGNGNGNGGKNGNGNKNGERKTRKEQIKDDAQSTQGELPEGDPGEVQDVDPTSCEEGYHWDADQQMCVPNEKKDPGDGQTQGTDKTASIERIRHLEAQVNKLAKETRKPTAQVGNSRSDRILNPQELARDCIEHLENQGFYQFHIPIDVMRATRVAPADNTQYTGRGGIGVQECYRTLSIPYTEAYNKPNKLLKEAVVISGTHATQDLDTDVAIVPGGITFVPVFQFAKVKHVEQGMDRARFFKTSLPANGSQTVGSTPSEATQTLTSVEITPSTITGVYLKGDYDEIENSPFDLIQAIVEASAATFDDFVATDMLDTVSKEGTLTPGLWIRADTGATVTESDITGITFDETGVAYGREFLEDQGYLRGGVKPVLFVHPQQWRELITSTNVTSLATRSVPDIWLKAQLEELFGVQLVVTNAIEAKDNTATDAYNAIMCVPKHSYGIAIKRDVTVKFHDVGEDNQIRINTSWRAKAGVIDATSIVRITSAQ